MLGAIGVKEHTMKKDWIPMLCTFDLALILTKNELETSTFSHLKNDNWIGLKTNEINKYIYDFLMLNLRN